MSPLPASEEAIRLRSTISVPPWKRRRADCRCTERPDNGWTMQTVSTVNGYDGDALNRWFPWCHITRKRCLSTLDNRPVTIHPPRDDLSPSLPPSFSLSLFPPPLLHLCCSSMGYTVVVNENGNALFSVRLRFGNVAWLTFVTALVTRSNLSSTELYSFVYFLLVNAIKVRCYNDCCF